MARLPGDTNAVAGLLEAGGSATARVSGTVPTFRRQRVQLVVEIGHAIGGV